MTYKAGTQLINKDGKWATRRQHFMDDVYNTAFWTVLFGMFIYCLWG